MSKEFDLFGPSESDNLQEELSKNSYSWTNKLTWVLMGVLIFVAGGSFGIWSADKLKNDSAVSNQNKQNKSQNIAADNSASNSDATKNRGTNRGQGGQRGGTVGVIKKIDGSVLEMETPDGKIVKVTSSETTRVLSTSSESFAALKVGDSVSVLGDTDANGAITSNLITKGEGAPRSAGSNGNPPQTADQSANQGAKEKGKTKGKGNNNKKNSGSAPKSSSTGTTEKSIQGQPKGEGKGGGNKGGGGALRNPEFRKCLEDEGITITPGTRPDMSDPKVAAAFDKCRPLLPQVNAE